MNDPTLMQRFRSWLAGVFFEAAAKLDASYDVWLDDAPPRYAVPELPEVEINDGFGI